MTRFTCCVQSRAFLNRFSSSFWGSFVRGGSSTSMLESSLRRSSLLVGRSICGGGLSGSDVVVLYTVEEAGIRGPNRDKFRPPSVQHVGSHLFDSTSVHVADDPRSLIWLARIWISKGFGTEKRLTKYICDIYFSTSYLARDATDRNKVKAPSET